MVKITELHFLKCSIGSFTLDDYSGLYFVK